MHNHHGSKVLLLLAALSLVAGAACVRHASAASANKTCKKDNCKTPKKSCLSTFKAEFNAAKAACKAAKTDGMSNCGKDKECKKGVKLAFQECKKDASETNKENRSACKTGFESCKDCCKAGKQDCTIAICGDRVRFESEECDTTNEACPDTYTCIPAGDRDECTCARPCELDPVPTKLKFTTQLPSGICGCALKSAGDTTCDAPSKIGNLDCGALFLGGGLSSVPPGPTPDGATTFVEFTDCRGSELIIGPSAGTGAKDCSFGTEEGGGPCYYGPALPIVNNTNPLSTCVLNTLKKNITGTTDPTTGHATMENVDLNSHIYLTGDMIKNTCRGGTNPGAPCVFGETTCDGICAVQKTAECEGGANNGGPCTYSVCDGGTMEGNKCTEDSDCSGGGTCKGICADNEQALCTDDSDCSTGTCTVNDCPGGTCNLTGSTVEPCPVCTNGNFDPITDGSQGTCNLGARKGQPCASTNSTGLTVDCLPADDTFLADIGVTIPAITTGTAELIADEDGTFCNFGECIGGERDFDECNNNRDCPGGFCQKLCQVLGGPDQNDPNNDPSCESLEDCIEPGQLGWRPCGQSEVGAFIRSAGEEDTPVGGPEVRRVVLTGEPAEAPVEIGQTKSSKLVAAFCIPRTGKQEVDNAGSLPGPGATSLVGTVTLLAE